MITLYTESLWGSGSQVVDFWSWPLQENWGFYDLCHSPFLHVPWYCKSDISIQRNSNPAHPYPTVTYTSKRKQNIQSFEPEICQLPILLPVPGASSGRDTVTLPSMNSITTNSRYHNTLILTLIFWDFFTSFSHVHVLSCINGTLTLALSVVCKDSFSHCHNVNFFQNTISSML